MDTLVDFGSAARDVSGLLLAVAVVAIVVIAKVAYHERTCAGCDRCSDGSNQ